MAEQKKKLNSQKNDNDGAKETEIQSHDQESAHSGLFHRHAAGVVKDGDHEQRQEKNNSRNTDTQQQMKRTLGAIIVTLVAIIVLGTSTACFILILRQPGPEEFKGHSKIMQDLVQRPEMNKLMDELQSKLDDRNTNAMSILVTGKTGVGKSALINRIIGRPIIPVVDNVLKPATEDVEDYDLTIGDVHIKVWDTHGFQEGATVDETKYLEDMKRNCEKVDLVLYCLRMDDTRMRNGDKDAIVKLTTTFGNSIWDHALFVLTFANKVEPPKKKDRDKLEEYFKGRVEAWTEMLDIILRDTGVELGVETVRRKVVPAGFEDASLPGHAYWLSDLWIAAFNESTANAKPLLLAIKKYDGMVAGEENISVT